MNNQRLALQELLSHANLESQLPVTLKLGADVDAQAPTTHELFLERVIKRVPDKRVVCQGMVDGKAKLIKFFIQPKRHKLHCKREYEASLKLAKHTVNSIACEQLTNFESNQISILMYDYLEQARSLSSELSAQASEQDLELIAKSVEALAELYQQKIIQRDLHLGNILVSQGKLYFIDADTMAFSQQQLTTGQILDNFSLFWAQLSPIYQLHLEQFSAQLNQHLASDKQLTLLQLSTKVEQHKQHILHRFKTKTLRKATAFNVIHRSGFKIHVDNRFNAISKGAVELALEELIKKRPHSRVIDIGKQTYLLSVTKKSQCKALWQIAQVLNHQKIPALKPIALIEQKRFLGRGKSAFLATYSSDDKQHLINQISHSNNLKTQWIHLAISCYLAKIIPYDLMQQLTIAEEQLQLCHFEQINCQPTESQLVQFADELMTLCSELAIDPTVKGYEKLAKLQLVK